MTPQQSPTARVRSQLSDTVLTAFESVQHIVQCLGRSGDHRNPYRSFSNSSKTLAKLCTFLGEHLTRLDISLLA